MGPHVEAEEHLPSTELWQVVSCTDLLKTASHVFAESCSFKGVYAPGKVQGEILIVQVLHQVD